VRRPLLIATLPLAAALALTGCGAGNKGPQYMEHTSSDFVTRTLPNGLALGAGVITTPGKKGGAVAATFTLGVLTGSGDTLVGVSSPEAAKASFGLLADDGSAPPRSKSGRHRASSRCASTSH
jgi:hypothetical protein